MYEPDHWNKKHDTRFWFFYTKIGKWILSIVAVAILISVVLKYFGVIN